MNLLEVMELIPQGEAKDIYLGGQEGDRILPVDYNKVIPHINMALTELCTRFLLHEKSVFITLDDTIDVYQLVLKYSVVNNDPTVAIKYITDTVNDPFTEDVLQLERVLDSAGVELPLNKRFDDKSLFTVSHNKLKVPSPTTGDVLEIVYRANHPKLDLSNLPDETALAATTIDIPQPFIEPLILYVAYRLFAGLPPIEGIKDSSVYLLQFEESCRKLRTHGVVYADHTIDQKLTDNGWT